MSREKNQRPIQRARQVQGRSHTSRRAAASGGKRAHSQNKRPVKRPQQRAPMRKSARPVRFPRAGKRSYSPVIVTGILFIFVIAYIVYTLFSFITRTRVQSELISFVNIETPLELDGVIIRDETVYYSSSNGVVSYNVNNLDKVKKGTVICSIQDQAEVDRINQDLSKLDGEIMKLQTRRDDMLVFYPDIVKINDKIQNMVNKSIFDFFAGDMKQAYSLIDDITINVNIRNQMILNENTGSMKDFFNDRQRYQNELDQYVSNLTANEGGIVSNTVDGYEDELTFDDLYGLSKEKTQTKVDFDKITPGKEVADGDSVFKIIRSNEWYIASYVPNRLIDSYEEGDAKTLYLQKKNAFIPEAFTISKITRGEKESYVLFKSTRNMIDYLDMRGVRYKMTEGVRKGYKISETAVVDRTMLKIPNRFVYGEEKPFVIMQSAPNEPMTVKQFSKDTEYTYIMQDYSGIKMGDILMTMGTDGEPETWLIADVEYIKGVYVINGGVADFTRVVPDEAVSASNGYISLDPAQNKGLSVYDRIATDAKSIVEGEFVYY